MSISVLDIIASGAPNMTPYSIAASRYVPEAHGLPQDRMG